jgi:large subunit ribosomal protein L9
MIEAILKKDLPSIGKAGDIIKVKEGYLRNYLLPHNLAVEVTPNNLKVVQVQKEKDLLSKEKEKKDALALANKIKGLSFNIKKEATEKDALYGSVTALDIQKVLSEEGFDVAEGSILLNEPIKNLGVYEVEIKLYPEVGAKLKIWVVKR